MHHPEWILSTRTPALAATEVHVWRIALDCGDDVLAHMRDTLADEEKQRVDRFYFDKDRRHFLAGRGSLRAILAHYLDCQPGQVRFAYASQGKPMLAGATDLRFNLTHSHGLALLAVTRGREIGVDVERIRDDIDREPLAERFFSPVEVAALRSLPVALRREAFYRCWTRKEAFIKAIGKGLSLPLDRFDVTLTPGEPAALLATHYDPPEASRWSMCNLSPGDGFAGALAIEGHSWRLWCGHWGAT